MRPDDDIDRTRGQLLGDLTLFGVGPKAGQHLDADRKGSQPLAERLEMLLGQHRRGHENPDLPALHHRLESRAHRDLRLPIADVPADEAVHRPCCLHVLLDRCDGSDLVGRFDVRKRRLQFHLPRRVSGIRVTPKHLSCRVQRQQVPGQRLHCLPHSGLRPLPFAARQSRQVRLAIRRPDVAAYAVELVRGNEELVLLGVLQLQVFALVPVNGHSHDPRKARDAVVDMDHVRARRQFGEERLAVDRPPGCRPPLLREPEDLGVGHDPELKAVLAEPPTFGERALQQCQPRQGFARPCAH